MGWRGGMTKLEQRHALQLDELRKAKEAEVAKVKEYVAAKAIRIRQEAAETAEGLKRDKIADMDEAVADAKAKVAEAESKLAKLSEQYELPLTERLGSLREIMEKAKDNAVNAEKAKAFDENLKLINKVDALQRDLEKKTNEELGEVAEIELFEALKEEFPDDRIERVAKGDPGADILHAVMHNGRECGTIIYDSKNRKMFRNEHVTKLLENQLAAKAEYAILSTHMFPRGTHHCMSRTVWCSPTLPGLCRLSPSSACSGAGPYLAPKQRRTREQDSGSLRVHDVGTPHPVV